MGGEVALYLAWYLLADYGRDPQVTRLVDTRVTYIVQESNPRALVDFIIGHPAIGQVESFHTTSGIHLRPYAARPDTGFLTQDLQDFSAVLAKGTEITGYPVASIYNDVTDMQPGIPPDAQPDVRHGVFVDWAYADRGLFAITTERWTLAPFLNKIDGWGTIPRDKPLFAIPDTSMEQARLAQMAKPVDVSIELAAGVATTDRKTVAFPFLRGTRGSGAESLYTAAWRVSGAPGSKVTVTVRSEKGGTDRRVVTLGQSSD
jgi:hypothetical protein